MYVIYDLETTGLSGSTCDVVQFAYIMFDSDMRFLRSGSHHFYYEGMSWSEKAYEVHKKSRQFLKQFENEFEENLIKMYTTLNRAHLVGFNNVSFDNPFSNAWLKRMGLPELNLAGTSDVMSGFSSVMGRSRFKLDKLIEKMEITDDLIEQYTKMWGGDSSYRHDAFYDVVVTALLFLIGKGKGLFHDTSKQDSSVLEDIDKVDLDSTKLPDPRAVFIDVRTKTGTLSTYVYVTDVAKYSTTLESYPTDLQKFPYIFEYVNEDTCQCLDNPAPLIARVDGNCIYELKPKER